MTRLGDSLQTLPSDTKLVVKLGRALKQGEFRIKIFLLDIRSVDVRAPAVCARLECACPHNSTPSISWTL